MAAVKQDSPMAEAAESSLAIFAVLVGLALTEFILAQFRNPIDTAPLVRWSLFAALVGLLLRYFIGSAIHIRRTYVYSPPFKQASWFLLKDLIFLVLFGVYAVAMSQSEHPSEFMTRAIQLLAIAFVWSLLDPISHVGICGKPPAVSSWKYWIWINFAQLVVTLVILQLLVSKGKMWGTALLGAIYSGLFVLEYVYDLHGPSVGEKKKTSEPVLGLRVRIVAVVSLVLFIGAVAERIFTSTALLSHGKGLDIMVVSIVLMALCDFWIWRKQTRGLGSSSV